MSIVSVLSSPKPPYRYIYIVAAIAFSITIFLQINNLLPPYDPLTYIAGLVFGVGFIAAFLMSVKPFENAITYFIKRREYRTSFARKTPLRSRLIGYALIRSDRENFLNNLSMFLGSILLLPGLYLTLQIWPYLLNYLILCGVLIFSILFLGISIWHYQILKRRVDIMRYFYLARRRTSSALITQYGNEFRSAESQSDWKKIEDIQVEIMQRCLESLFPTGYEPPRENLIKWVKGVNFSKIVADEWCFDLTDESVHKATELFKNHRLNWERGKTVEVDEFFSLFDEFVMRMQNRIQKSEKHIIKEGI